MRPHRTDGISLSFGLIFLLVAVWWATAQVVDVQLPAAGWLVAGALILFGVIGLLGAIRSGRRTEVSAPVRAEAQVETPGDLPPNLHADIVRELLDNPADRVDLNPAYLKHPVSAPPAATHPASAPPPANRPASAPPAANRPVSGPPGDEPTAQVAADAPTAEVAADSPTAEVTRVDPERHGDPDGAGNGDPAGSPRRG